MSPAYAYRAVDASGKRVRGEGEAASSIALVRSLERNGLFVLEVERAGGGQNPSSRFRFRSRSRSVLQLTRALAALLSTSMPVPKALLAAGRATGEPIASVVEEIRRRVERGDALAAALQGHPELFPAAYVGVVRAGEKSGDLASAFARLAAQLEGQEKLRARLLSASIYPLILGILGGLSVVILLLFVIPRFVDLLEGSGASLPRSTAVLLSVSSAIRRGWWLALVGLVGLALASLWLGRSGEEIRVVPRLLNRLPVARGLRRDLLAGRYARLVGVLLGGGAPLLSALEDAASSLADPLAREEAERIRREVREGSALHRAIREGGLFPDLLAQVVEVGEESGRMEEFLLKAAEILEDRTDRTLQRLVTLAEPAMIVVFGGIVAFVAFSLLQAIYSVNAGVFR